MRHLPLGTCLALFGLVFLFASIARGEQRSRVVLFGTENGPAPQGFVKALSIQLAGVGTVELGTDLEGTLPTKLEIVKARLSTGARVVAVWVERAPSEAGQEYVVHVVSRRHDRVLVSVVRLPGPESPETDRALSLKVKEVIVDVIQAGVERAAVAVPTPEPASASPAPPVVREGVRAGLVLDASLLGASSGDGTGDEQLGARAGVGARLHRGAWILEALVWGGAMNGTGIERDRREVDTREVLVAATLRALLASRWAAAGVFAGSGARIVSASGRAPDGRTGEATEILPVVSLGPETRAVLGEQVAIRAGVGVELALRRQRFSVDGDPLADVGSLRGVAELGVVVTID